MSTRPVERVVWKFPFPDHRALTLYLVRPKVVHVGNDPTGLPYLPCVWIEHRPDPDGIPDKFRLFFRGTGTPIFDDTTHVGSVVTPEGQVWHVYLDSTPIPEPS